MSTFDASKNQFNQYHFTVVEMDLPIVTGASSLTTAIELAEPQWYWKLNEETGIVATDTMLNGNLEYESAASTAGYNIIPSSADGLGSAKNIRGDVTFQIYDPVPPVTAPIDYIAYWTMDNAQISGTTMLDLTVNNSDMVIEGSPTTGGVGQVAESILLNGTSQRFKLTLSTGELRPTVFTYSSWVKTTASTTGIIVENWVNSSGSLYGVEIVLNASGIPYANVGKGTGTTPDTDYKVVTATTSINDDSWHLVTLTYDDNTIKIFVDGVEESSNVCGSGWCVYLSTGYTFAIGSSAGNTFHFAGSVDDVKVFDRAISATEISDIFSSDGGT